MTKRRAFTFVELLIAGVIVSLVVTLAALTLQTSSQTFRRFDANESAKRALMLAIGKMAPDVRAALRVNTATSTSTKLVLVMPDLDAAGNIVVPLVDGDLVTYYLSNSTGSMAASGNYLWKAVNGVPDSGWSMRSGKPVVDTDGGTLTFTYLPASSPSSIRVSVTASRKVRIPFQNKTITHTSSTELFLRNRKFS